MSTRRSRPIRVHNSTSFRLVYDEAGHSLPGHTSLDRATAYESDPVTAELLANGKLRRL